MNLSNTTLNFILVGYAVVETYTHDTQSITQRDIDLANAINELEA